MRLQNAFRNGVSEAPKVFSTIPAEPQSPNGKSINLHKKCNFCVKSVQKCGFAHFLLALFLESAVTPLLVQINVFAVWALRLEEIHNNSFGADGIASNALQRGKPLRFCNLHNHSRYLRDRRPCTVPEVGMTDVYFGDLSRIPPEEQQQCLHIKSVQ